MEEFGLWIEGYSATGDYSPARFLGYFEGENFNDACLAAEKAGVVKLDKVPHGGIPSEWGCNIFDNETDARKAFG